MTEEEFQQLEKRLLAQMIVQRPLLHRILGGFVQADAWVAAWWRHVS